MLRSLGTVLLLLATVWCCCVVHGIETTEEYNNTAVLDADKNYNLFWKFNDTHIIFEVHVKTKGWVGLGISDNGNMFPADVAVGWVTDAGKVNFADRHTVAHEMPVKDASQDWYLLHGEERDGYTLLKMVRPLQSCDRDDDKDIVEGTNRIIYAYGSSDPADENSIQYHGNTRGTQSLSLLTPGTVPSTTTGPVKHYDLLNQNFIVPSVSTTYWCRGFKMPDLGKHHMIKYAPIITPGNERIVHHILIYRCKVENSEQYDGITEKCYGNHEKKLPDCFDTIIAWAIGGQPFNFPDDVGFSVDTSEDGDFYLMETHYDNPDKLTDVIDNSGIRITMTTELRKHEAGMLMMGQRVGDYHMIPPGLPAYLSSSYCQQDCLQHGFNQENLTEVKVFGALQHSHLLGVAITTRHFRNGEEIKPLIQDPNYDFDFQEMRMLPHEVPIYPGDGFQVDCIYDSSDKKVPTMGGLSTTQEMCLTFAYHYPALPTTNCLSATTLDTFKEEFSDFSYKNYISGTDWSNSSYVDEYIQLYDSSTMSQFCGGKKFKEQVVFFNFKPEVPENPYVPPPPDCE